MSEGETDLATLLTSMEPVLHAAPYGYVAITPAGGPPTGWLAMIKEAEGLFAVAPADDGDLARISLTVHSSLHAVGLTAAISGALAECGISANIVAGMHHDHLLVPWDRRDDAMRLLSDLSNANR